jgi:hypothetical protein
VAQVDGQAVGDVEQRVRVLRERPSLLDAQRRANVALGAKRGARRAQRPADDEHVARPSACAARDAVAVPECRHRDDDLAGGGRVAAHDRDTGLGDPLVERDDIGGPGARRRCKRHEQRLRCCTRSGEVAEVDGRGAEAKLAPGDPVEAKVHALDERVLRYDEVGAEERRIVLDADDQPTTLELREEPELTARRKPRQPPS